MLRRSLAAAVAALAAGPVHAQFVTFGGPGSTSIDFNSLATSGNNNTWTNGSTVNGAYAFRSNGNQGVTAYVASDGSAAASGLYSFGTTGATERALGTVSGGSVENVAFGLVVQNTSTTPLAVSLAYTGEQWRSSGLTTPQTLNFSFRTFAAAAPTAINSWTPGEVTPAGYTDLNALDFTAPVTSGTGGAVDGNAAANRTVFGNTPVATVNPGDFLVLRWYHATANNSDGLAIDDVTITAVPVPEPTAALGAAAVVLCVWLRRRSA